MQLTDQFKENYEYNGGQDIQAFMLASKKAYQCLNDLVTRMSAMPDKVKAESVNTLLVQQLDQTTFAESEVRQWEQNLREFNTALNPDRPAVGIQDQWSELNTFIEANQAQLSILSDVDFLTTESQFVVTDTNILAFPAAALFRMVQAETGEADTIDLAGMAQNDPAGVAEIAAQHKVPELVNFTR